jgi:uncharacterized damage-inducible protein DinB
MDRIAEQLRAAFEGPAWHGPSVMEALSGVDASLASRHPLPGRHSIHELVLHLAGTYGLVLRRLDGDGRQLAPDEDWPSIPDAAEETWRASVDALRRLNAELRRRVLIFPPERLDEPLVRESPYPAYQQFIGVTQHDLYHAGQMVLLKLRVLGLGSGV